MPFGRFQKSQLAKGMGPARKKMLGYKDKKAVVGVVKRQLAKQAELKWFGGGWVDTAVGSGAGYQQQNMTLIGQGLADNQRIGDQIKLKSIHLNVRLKGPTTAVSPLGQSVRVMVFQFKAPSTTAAPIAPSVNQLLIADVATGGRSALSFRYVDYQRSYIMLFDRTYHIDDQATNVGTAGNWLKLIKLRIPLKYCKRTIEFSAGGMESSNSIWVAAIGSEPLIGAGNDARIAVEYRLRYTDA